jgi:hypothetical protein
MAASTTIYQGSLVALNAAGYAIAGATATTLTAAGMATETVVNAGLAGAASVPVQRGVFGFASDGSLTVANIGKVVYIVDDQTIAATNGTSTRSAAGTLVDFNSTDAIAWVRVGF